MSAFKLDSLSLLLQGGLRPVIVFSSRVACVSLLTLAPSLVSAKEEWQPSTLNEKTLKKVEEAVSAYQHCLNEETRRHLKEVEDSRRLTDRILSACDDRLSPIKSAFKAEKVPDALTDRYLRRKRSLAAQQVVRVVMSEQALRYREPAP